MLIFIRLVVPIKVPFKVIGIPISPVLGPVISLHLAKIILSEIFVFRIHPCVLLSVIVILVKCITFEITLTVVNPETVTTFPFSIIYKKLRSLAYNMRRNKTPITFIVGKN